MSLSKLQLSELLSVYGETLTAKQREAVAMYCDCDCTLSEIADELSITRQGVRDAIVKAEASLVKLESELKLAELCRNLRVAIAANDVDKIKQIAKQYVSKE